MVMAWNGMGWVWMECDEMGWQGMALDGLGKHGIAWDGIGWPWVAWENMTWHGMAWHGMAWHSYIANGSFQVHFMMKTTTSCHVLHSGDLGYFILFYFIERFLSTMTELLLCSHSSPPSLSKNEKYANVQAGC